MTIPTLSQTVAARMKRTAEAALIAELEEQRAPLVAALKANEVRHARELPKLERAAAETLARLRRAEAEVEAARGPAYLAENALSSERSRSDRERSSLRAQLFELADPRLTTLYLKAARGLEGFKFASPPPPPTRPVAGLFGGPVRREVVPGYVAPEEDITRARRAVEALRNAMEEGQRDVAAIQAAFFAAVPGDFAVYLRQQLASA